MNKTILTKKELLRILKSGKISFWNKLRKHREIDLNLRND
jgi:hypothetical protein